jgi:hypothetical protein
MYVCINIACRFSNDLWSVAVPRPAEEELRIGEAVALRGRRAGLRPPGLVRGQVGCAAAPARLRAHRRHQRGASLLLLSP